MDHVTAQAVCNKLPQHGFSAYLQFRVVSPQELLSYIEWGMSPAECIIQDLLMKATVRKAIAGPHDLCKKARMSCRANELPSSTRFADHYN